MPWHQVVDVPDNGTTFYDDLKPDAQLSGKNYPAFSTATDVGEATTVTVPVSPDARIARRRLYRKDGGGEYRLIAEIPDNAATTFADVAIGPGGNLAPSTNAITTGAINLSESRDRARRDRATPNLPDACGRIAIPASLSKSTTTRRRRADTTADSNLGGSPQPPIGSPRGRGIPPTPAGRNYLQVDDVTGFSAAGWLLLESGMMIRYTAIDTVGNYIGGSPRRALARLRPTSRGIDRRARARASSACRPSSACPWATPSN